jgi:hypothetical protein
MVVLWRRYGVVCELRWLPTVRTAPSVRVSCAVLWVRACRLVGRGRDLCRDAVLIGCDGVAQVVQDALHLARDL